MTVTDSSCDSGSSCDSNPSAPILTVILRVQAMLEVMLQVVEVKKLPIPETHSLSLSKLDSRELSGL